MIQDTWPPPSLGIDSNGMVVPTHPGMMTGHHPQQYNIGKRLWRKGKWTDEEEKYTKKLIAAFNQGYLQLPPGTTLRCFLSEKLNWCVLCHKA